MYIGKKNYFFVLLCLYPINPFPFSFLCPCPLHEDEKGRNEKEGKERKDLIKMPAS